MEPSNAFAEAIKIAPKLSKDTVICVNSCGDALKDRDILRQKLGKYKSKSRAKSCFCWSNKNSS